MRHLRRVRWSHPARILAAAALAAALVPAPGRALSLLQGDLVPGRPAPDLSLALAAEKPATEGGGASAPAAPAPAPSLDFDLLPEPPPVAPNPADGSMRLRRRMLRLHQGIGLGLVALQLSTTAVGQLNYSDRFGGSAPPSTARYQATHAVLAYATLGAFAVNGAIALLAPRPPGKRSQGVDRVTVHKLGMLAAAAGMVAQGALGIYTREREGYLNQQHYAQVHLAIGYATLAAVSVAVGALVL